MQGSWEQAFSGNVCFQRVCYITSVWVSKWVYCRVGREKSAARSVLMVLGNCRELPPPYTPRSMKVFPWVISDRFWTPCSVRRDSQFIRGFF